MSIIAAALGLISSASAQTNFYYDANGATGGIGGTGNWTTTGTTWTTNPAGTNATVSGGWTNGSAWSNNTANNAILQGTAGTVSLSSSSVFANQIQVNTNGFTIQNSSTGTSSANRYFRTKNGIILADGVNLNISSGVGTNGTSGALTGFEGPITNAVGASNTSVTITGSTTDTNGNASSVRIGIDTSASDIWVPLNVASTGLGYALLTVSSPSQTANVYNNVTVASGSRLVLGHAGMTSTRRLNIRTNLTTVNTDLTIGESGMTGVVVLYGSNSIGGNILVNGPLGYANTNAFGNSTVTLNSGSVLGATSFGTSSADRTITNNLSILADVTFGLRGQSGFSSGSASYFAGSINLNGGNRTFRLSNSTVMSGVISNGGITATDISGSTTTLTLSATNTFTGPTVISNGGRIAVSGSIGSSTSITAETGGGLGYASTNAFGTNTIVLKTGSFFGQIDGMGTNIAERTIANNISLQGNTIFGFGTYANYFSGGLDLGGATNRNIYLSNSTTAFGVISNGGLVINDTVEGTNNGRRTFTIASPSTFAGSTVVAGGVTNLTVITTNTNTTPAVTNTNIVPVAYGPILLVTGSLASSNVLVQTNATLAGTGSLSNVVVQAGGELSPGDATAEPIAINGSLSLESGSTANMRILSLATYDQVISSTSTALNGTVNVTFSTNFTPAEGTFQLFSGTVSGSPTLVVPLLTNASLVWVTNNFATTGSISIASSSGSQPVITSSNVASGVVGAAFSYSISADNSPTSYGATGLPAGLSVNSANGVISGTPTTAGVYPATISASNSAGIGTNALTITVISAYQSWANGAPLNSTNQLIYAIGGASSPSATNGVASVTTVTSNALSITAIVRTNDANLAVFGQSTLDLPAGVWSSNGVTMTVPVDQTGATPGTTQRQIFSTTRTTGESKKFLRLNTSLGQ